MPNDSNILSWIGVGAVILLVLLGISYLFFPTLVFTESREAGAETVEQTYDADQAIQQYEEFRELYNEIEEERAQLENNEQAVERFKSDYGDPADYDRSTRQDYERLQQRVVASEQQLESLIAEYNAETQKANAELFKCNLPYQVDDRMNVQGPPGSEDADEAVVDEGPDGEPIDRSAEIPEPEQCDGLPDEIQQQATS